MNTPHNIIPHPSITVIPAKRKRIHSNESCEMIKVAAYCRVSTEEENQQNSYATQISYYTDYITRNPDWQLVGIYADEGISGTRTKNRTQFNKMIRAARRKKIDLILCKSISRFARNTVDCLDYVRELKALGVTVIFEKENINTSSMNSEFAISLYASFAQAESESLSKNTTWGIAKGFREGKVQYRFNQMLGYRLGDDGEPYIVEEEAEIVRYIFREYAAGETSTTIAKTLTEMGAKRRSGSTHWTRHHVYQVLINEKYVGDALLQKTYTEDCIAHDRRKNHGERPMYYVQDCHEAIIDRKTYDIVRLELEKRKRKTKTSESTSPLEADTKYCLSRLMVCPYCGGMYKRVIWREKAGKVGVWRCKSRLMGEKCPNSSSYHEEPLQNAVIAAVNSFISGTCNLSPTSEKSPTGDFGAIERRIETIHDELTKIEMERDSILSNISGTVFDSMSERLKELNRQESEYADQLKKLRDQLDNYKRNQIKEEKARQLLKGLKPLEQFDDDIIGKILSKIEAISKNEIKVTFYGGYSIVQVVKKH